MDRILRVNSLVQKELSLIIQREVELFENALLTISEVDTSPDLKYADVFVSIIPKNREKEVIAELNEHIYDIQKELNKRLVMRAVPKIRFKVDAREERAARIEKIIEDEHQE